jgi:secreted trypsin-like serine protease
MTSQTSSAPMMSVVLPFNARLFSTDIPLVGGGVRTGGCSGSLIAPMWVITAGHCFHDVHEVRVSGTPPYHMTITVGKLKDSDPGGQTAQVVDVRQSPMNDLAVVKLSTAITGVTPLTLAQQRPSVDEDLQFAGWGALSASDTDIVQSDHLKRGQFSVSEVRSTTVEATSTEPRTVENVPCPDDSGSPFFESSDERTGVLVAIVDNGPACPAPGPEILARVDVVADWIQEQIGSTTP